MTRTEAFDKSWRLGFRGDFSLFDEIYHPDFKGINPIVDDVELNFDAFKEGVKNILEDFIIFVFSILHNCLICMLDICFKKE